LKENFSAVSVSNFTSITIEISTISNIRNLP